MTPSEEPSAAMMKENSPTWAMLMEHFTVVLSDCLETSAPSDTQRGEDDGQYEPDDQVERHASELYRNGRAVYVRAHSKGGEHHHEKHGCDILDNKHAENESCEPFVFQVQFVERLRDDRRRRDGDHAAEKQAREKRPAKQGAARESCDHHKPHLDECRQNGGAACGGEPCDTEFQPQAEHEEDDAYL